MSVQHTGHRGFHLVGGDAKYPLALIPLVLVVIAFHTQAPTAPPKVVNAGPVAPVVSPVAAPASPSPTPPPPPVSVPPAPRPSHAVRIVAPPSPRPPEVPTVYVSFVTDLANAQSFIDRCQGGTEVAEYALIVQHNYCGGAWFASLPIGASVCAGSGQELVGLVPA